MLALETQRLPTMHRWQRSFGCKGFKNSKAPKMKCRLNNSHPFFTKIKHTNTKPEALDCARPSHPRMITREIVSVSRLCS